MKILLANRRPLIILAITLMVNRVLAVVFREFLRENVLVPILYLVFYIRLFLKSLGETCLWPFLILLVFVVSLRLFRRQKKDRQKVIGYREEPLPGEDGRVAFWLRFIKHKSLGMENLSLVSFRLKELVSSVVSYQENLTQKELDEAATDGRLHLPREIQVFLDPKYQVTASPTRKVSLIEHVLAWLKVWGTSNQDENHQELRVVIQYLENQLELEHDDGD